MKNKISKRIFTLLLAAMLVFPLASCGGEYPEANEPEPNTSVVSTPPETPVTIVPPSETPIVPEPDPDTIQYQADFKLKDLDRAWPPNKVVAVFNSMAEMTDSDYYSNMMPEHKRIEFYENYDTRFYEQKILVLITVITEDDWNTSEITSVSMDEQGKLGVTVDIELPSMFTDGQTLWWTILLALDRDIPIDDPEDVNLTVNYYGPGTFFSPSSRDNLA